MLKAAESFFEWAVKRAAVMIAHAACDQHDREVRRGQRQDEVLQQADAAASTKH
jgi:hypothetical protein